VTGKRLDLLNLAWCCCRVQLVDSPRIGGFLKPEMVTRWHAPCQVLGAKHRFPRIRNPSTLVHRFDDRVARRNTREKPPHAAEASGPDTMGEQRLPYRLGSIHASRRANRRDNPAPVWSAWREAYEADELAIRDGDEGWTLFTEHR
jgi:hypothetical protein